MQQILAFPIWQPKFSTKMVLVDKAKVHSGKNFIYFVADRNHPFMYSYNGDKVKEECDLSWNGKIFCYNIPLEWLENEGEIPEEYKERRDKEYQKFLNQTKKGNK